MTMYLDNVNMTLPSSLNTNLEVVYNTYIFEAPSTNSTSTYNLPEITCDGIKFQIVRADTDNTSFLNVVPYPGQQIYYNGIFYTTFPVSWNRMLNIIAFENNWYVSSYSTQFTKITNTIVSGNFITDSNTPYKIFLGNGNVPVLFATFNYLGANSGKYITRGLFSLNRITAGAGYTVSISLRDQSNNVIASTGNVASSTISFQLLNRSTLPLTSTVLGLYIAVSGDSTNIVGIYSYIIN